MPGLRRIVAPDEAVRERLVASTVEAIWAQVAAYRDSADEQLREEVTGVVRAMHQTLVTSLAEARPPCSADFASARDAGLRRAAGGVPLAAVLQAFQVGQTALWLNMLESLNGDTAAQEAALSVVGHLMQVVEMGSAVAAAAYLQAQQDGSANREQVRRDLLEDLLAGRGLAPGPKVAAMRAAGLEPGAGMLVFSAGVVAPAGTAPAGGPGEAERAQALRAIAIAVRRAGCGGGLTVARQNEIVGVLPVPARGPAAVIAEIEQVAADAQRRGVPLAVGVSTVRTGPAEVPAAYAEARVARDGLGERAGVVALPLLSSFDYLLLRADETARRLVRPQVRRFVEDDAARGGALIATLTEYAACDLNARTAARRLHLHVNTAYYRLERIAERTGCDLRSVADLVELLIAVRLLGPPG
jgi:hypothetical protein